MRCPKCGKELRRSKKDPSYGLCDNCRKKYKLVHTPNRQTINTPTNPPDTKPTQTISPEVSKKKKRGCLSIILVIIIIFVILGVIGAIINGFVKSDEIKVLDVVGENAETASNSLKEAGFALVSLTPDESSESSMILDATNWTVLSQTPEAGSKGTKETEIKLFCRKTEEIEQEKLLKEETIEQEELQELINLSLPNANKKLNELGYTVQYFHQDSGLDMTEDLSVYSEDELDKWIVTDIQSSNINAKTVELVVNTSDNIAENKENEKIIDTLQNKLDATTAWQAVADYGKTEYPYGFKLHYIMGKLAEKPEDENTWFLKATCTVTNEFNANSEMTCEAQVTGTTSSPEIVDFKVY